MMENPRREEEKMIKDIRNLFKREKETNVLKDRVLRDTKHLFEYEEQENYYESVRVSNFWSNSYIEYDSNRDRNKIISVEKYLNKISPYLKDINNLKKSDTWKILKYKKNIIALYYCKLSANSLAMVTQLL